ncbi:hypothetical protein NMG60_11025226 [Bertholletia excelsa]
MERRQQKLPDIPNDVILEILSRLPHKSLCRFKLVSKQWLALITEVRLRCHELPDFSSKIIFDIFDKLSIFRFVVEACLKLVVRLIIETCFVIALLNRAALMQTRPRS